ncbi:radical SAM family heme chaperone HemW [bacterium]|nr:radical SAM family heme chaperone HemW [bacterium]
MYGLYVHIPFCLKKCFYCSFKTTVLFSGDSGQKSNKDEKVKEYLKAVKKELGKYRGEVLGSIYIGGGTPTILSSFQLENLFKFFSNNFLFKKKIEITVEANPGTLNKQKLKSLKEGGVNRLSIGLQSLDDRLLKRIGRIHTGKQFLDNFYLAREIGFDNINVDLIFALPGQKMSDWEKTLKKIINIKPEHISLYSLSIEQGTRMYADLKSGRIKPCNEDIEADMYEYAIKILTENGYQHYEISNFAFPHKSSKHNQLYWENKQYLGVGAGAVSFLGGTRLTNVGDIDEYIRKVNTDKLCMVKEKLTGEKAIAEKIILGLRMRKGIKVDKQIEKKFTGPIEELILKGLLERNEKNIRLTYKGLLLANQVFIEFL